MSRTPPTTLRVLGLTAVLALVTSCGVLLHRPADGVGLEVPWWVLAILFALAEAFVLRIRVRGQAEGISLSEIPLLLGLFLAMPSDLLAARVGGSALIFFMYHRHTLVKGTFNTALVGASTTAAIAVFHALTAGHDVTGPWGWGAGLLAAATGGLVDGTMLALVVRWYDGRRPRREVFRELAFSVAVPALVSIAGLVSVFALTRGATALPLAVTGLAVLVGYRAFATLSDRHASLERLYLLSDALAMAPGSTDIVASVLVQSTDLLRAEYTEVVLSGLSPHGAVSWSLRAGEEIEGPIEVRTPATWTGMPAGVQIIFGDNPTEMAFLTDRGVGQALLVPLRVDREVSGHLLVADRRGEERGFAVSDSRLLETVANHASVALRNSRLIDRLNHEARHDELTGLPNRLMFRDVLEEAAQEATEDSPVAVMMLDFDGFKAINDTLGHQAGDELLRVLSARLRDLAGDDARVARLGGDEFAVVSTIHAEPESVTRLADRLLGMFDEPVAVAGTRLRLSGSLGIALGPRHGRTASDLMRNADIAMYAAKSGAGGQRLFSQDMVEVTATALTLATDLRDAIERDEVGIVVQPIVHLDDGQVHSVEVLARWTHPDLGQISPEAFFGAADRSGQVIALSSRVLDRALDLCRRWHSAGHPIRVAVNLAPRWLADVALPEQIGLALARHSIPADLLTLEITETSVISDPKRATSALHRLRDMGVHLSVDDFGTGYSSMTYLSRMPVTQLKVDKSFVEGMQRSLRDRAIVRSIIDLGRNLGLEVVAEGVGDPGTRRALQEMGCGLAQGYLFSPPISTEELAGFVSSRGNTDRRQRGAALGVSPAGTGHGQELLAHPPSPREGGSVPASREQTPRVLP